MVDWGKVSLRLKLSRLMLQEAGQDSEEAVEIEAVAPPLEQLLEAARRAAAAGGEPALGEIAAGAQRQREQQQYRALAIDRIEVDSSSTWSTADISTDPSEGGEIAEIQGIGERKLPQE